MIDLLNNAQSPYRDGNGALIPVLKAGFVFIFIQRDIDYRSDNTTVVF